MADVTHTLITGPPRCGKTTLITDLVSACRDRNIDVGGFYTLERREDGSRVGFDIVDVETGSTATIADADGAGEPRVGRYRVYPEALRAIALPALQRAATVADVIVIDEIAPMQLLEEQFLPQVRQLLDRDTPVIGTIAARDRDDLVALKRRSDIRIVDLGEREYDAVFEHLLAELDAR